MATLDELELRLRALEQAQAAEPTSYYTSVFSGEEMDQRLAAAGVLGAASTPQEALAALGAGVRPSLLDNGCFVGGGTGWGVFPVNQRGQTSYTPVFNGRVMDRWAVEADADLKVTLEPDGILLENTGSSNRQLKQIMPSGILSVGNQYCISAMFDLIEGRSSVAIGEAVDPYETLGFVDLDNSGFAYKIVEPQKETEWKYIVYVYPGAKVKIKALKLEEGSSQTLAYQKSDGTWAMLPQGLNYQQELAKCQAYLQSFGIYDAFVCIDAADSYTDFQVPLSVPFRAHPVVLENGGIEGLSIGWYNKGNVLCLRILNRKGTVGEVITFSSPCFLSAEL